MENKRSLITGSFLSLLGVAGAVLAGAEIQDGAMVRFEQMISFLVSRRRIARSASWLSDFNAAVYAPADPCLELSFHFSPPCARTHSRVL